MKRLFITGGSGDIGKAIINVFEDNDYTIIAPSRKELDLEKLTEIDKYFHQENIDIDVYIHSAGHNDLVKFQDASNSEIERSLKINSLSFLRIMTHFRKILVTKKRGSVLVISSLYGTLARHGRLPYVLSKHSLMGIVKTLAIELGPYNININALSPGFVDTKMTRKNNDNQKIQKIKNSIPLGRLASTKDIANVTHFLCSDMSKYINGQNIIVDGGFSSGGFQALLD